MTKPLICVTPLYDDKLESLWMFMPYLELLRDVGAAATIPDFAADPEDCRQYYEACDGILFTGGQDVDPALYGQTPDKECGPVCSLRDRLEMGLFKAWREDGCRKPVFGICRGIQFLNAVMGGTLYQDLPTQVPSPLAHFMGKPNDIPAHTVTVVENTPLAELAGAPVIGVNSLHHQAVRILAPGLEAMAYSPEGFVEAFWAPDLPFLQAVQWHPECMWRKDRLQRELLARFIQACR